MPCLRNFSLYVLDEHHNLIQNFEVVLNAWNKSYLPIAIRLFSIWCTSVGKTAVIDMRRNIYSTIGQLILNFDFSIEFYSLNCCLFNCRDVYQSIRLYISSRPVLWDINQASSQTNICKHTASSSSSLLVYFLKITVSIDCQQIMQMLSVDPTFHLKCIHI